MYLRKHYAGELNIHVKKKESNQVHLSIEVNNVDWLAKSLEKKSQSWHWLKSPSQNKKWTKGKINNPANLFSLRIHICGHLLWFSAHGKVSELETFKTKKYHIWEIKHESFQYCNVREKISCNLGSMKCRQNTLDHILMGSSAKRHMEPISFLQNLPLVVSIQAWDGCCFLKSHLICGISNMNNVMMIYIHKEYVPSTHWTINLIEGALLWRGNGKYVPLSIAKNGGDYCAAKIREYLCIAHQLKWWSNTHMSSWSAVDENSSWWRDCVLCNCKWLLSLHSLALSLSLFNISSWLKFFFYSVRGPERA